jgi:TonB-linked SusC/RagA family outer membrane protein
MNDDLGITGLILYKQREYLADVPAGKDGEIERLINALPAREQSIAGRITTSYKNRYFLDVNFGGSGSQLFTPDKRWSTFPSFGAGWMISSEEFWKPIKDYVNIFKPRVSYGIVGSGGNAKRFAYLSTTGNYGGYSTGFGNIAGSGESITGRTESRLEQLGLTWEKQSKLDLGLEITLFRDLRIVFDYYVNHNEDQLIDVKQIPLTLGLPAAPKSNMGEMESKGFDLDITYSHDFGDFKINYIKAIVGYNENEIIENGEYNPKVPYQSGIGLDYGRGLNLISLGLFKDEEDIKSSPVQTFQETVRPGDIKYKDINGDGLVNGEDKVWLGNKNPKWTFSFSGDFSYLDWIFSMRWVGKADMYRSINGPRIPFNPLTIKDIDLGSKSNGPIYRDAYKNHWTPESYSGDANSENPDALYPRLGVGVENANNREASTFWLREASYLRLATLELGYNWLPQDTKLPFKSVYFYARGENLYTISDFDFWNPEQVHGYAYPLKQTVSLGIEIGFSL